VICIDARHIKAVANHTFVPADGTHQWLVMKMPNGPEKTTRTRDEAVQLALVSADTVDSSHQWWK
jgi:hypothetical protein